MSDLSLITSCNHGRRGVADAGSRGGSGCRVELHMQIEAEFSLETETVGNDTLLYSKLEMRWKTTWITWIPINVMALWGVCCLCAGFIQMNHSTFTSIYRFQLSELTLVFFFIPFILPLKDQNKNYIRAVWFKWIYLSFFVIRLFFCLITFTKAYVRHHYTDILYKEHMHCGLLPSILTKAPGIYKSTTEKSPWPMHLEKTTPNFSAQLLLLYLHVHHHSTNVQ